MKDTVLIFASSDNVSVDGVQSLLEALGEKIYRFDTDNFPSQIALGVELFHDRLSGFITDSSSMQIDLDRIKSCWYRGVRKSKTPSGMDDGYARFIQDEAKAVLWALYTSLDAFWVNPPLFGVSLIGNNKLYQLKTASQAGLATPKTVITNDPNHLLSFCRECGGEVAIKLLSGHVFMSEGSDEILGIYTQRVSEKEILDRYDDISLSPLLAQQYVSKSIEIRVTIVGERIFACAIHSQDSEKTKVDWRKYDFSNVAHQPHRLPDKIEEKLRRLMKVWGLQFGAIDMILTPKNEYVFLEVNPQGQWGWIEQLTGMPISQAIATLLANPP
ncbi:MAG: hypothetical protein Q8P45_00140 [Candidatus Harrisonbacteria bacterium]|nr:hypothetical protein [Candidatus Harrisonbacteria bacterium]